MGKGPQDGDEVGTGPADGIPGFADHQLSRRLNTVVDGCVCSGIKPDSLFRFAGSKTLAFSVPSVVKLGPVSTDGAIMPQC